MIRIGFIKRELIIVTKAVTKAITVRISRGNNIEKNNNVDYSSTVNSCTLPCGQ